MSNYMAIICFSLFYAMFNRQLIAINGEPKPLTEPQDITRRDN